MAKKEYIGIALDGNDLKIAHIRLRKKRIELLSTEKISLPEPIRQVKASELEPVESESEEMGSIFGLEEGDPSGMTGGGEGGEMLDLDSDISLDDGFDMTEEGSEEPGGGSNEGLIETVLSGISRKRVNIGLNIPYGNTIFQVLKDTDYGKMKKKERQAVIEEKLSAIYDRALSSDNYAFQVRKDNSLLLASFESEIPMLSTLDHVETFYKGKMFIKDVQADESVLVGLARANYDLQEDEYTGLVHIGENSTRIIFLKGRTIHMVMPLINQGSKSPRILNTIFSKMLFEVDKGELLNIDRIIITSHGGLGAKAVGFFKKQLKDIEVGLLGFDPEKFVNAGDDFTQNGTVPGGQKDEADIFGEAVDDHAEDVGDKKNGSAHTYPDLTSYSTAIGLAWSASGMDYDDFPHLSFIPAHVLERQRVFKLEWHGLLVLLMIAGTPFVVNQYYQENNTRITELENEVRLIDSQINETRPIATITEQLADESAVLQSQLELINELSQNTQKWSVTLSILNEGLRDVRNTWITQLRSANQGMVLEGYSLYRNRIPMLANKFHRATVRSVTEGEMRGARIYRFVILVDHIVADPEEFKPKPEPPPANITDIISIDPVRRSQ